MDDEVLTSRGACAFLKIGRTSLWQITRSGEVRHFRIGIGGKTSSLRYLKSDLLKWLTTREVSAPSREP